MSQAALDSTAIEAEKARERKSLAGIIRQINAKPKPEVICAHACIGQPLQCPNVEKRIPYCYHLDGHETCGDVLYS